MVRHEILWKIKNEYSQEEKKEIKANAKRELEALVGVVPGLQSLEVHTDGLESSNADMMLDSVLEDEAALKNYAGHPSHVKVADTFVRPFMEARLCLDFKA